MSAKYLISHNPKSTISNSNITNSNTGALWSLFTENVSVLNFKKSQLHWNGMNLVDLWHLECEHKKVIVTLVVFGQK